MQLPTKIFLADLGHTYSVNESSLPVPLNIGYIKAYAMATHGKSVDISLFKHPEKFLSRIADERPEIIGFSNYGWSENLNIAIGRHVRKLLPDALIIAGGPNIDSEPARRMAYLNRHDYVDFLIIDGGEEPFSEMIEWQRHARGDHTQLPKNIVWRKGDEIHFTGERHLGKVIDNIDSPYLGGYLDEFLEAGMIPMFETNRGCPFKCTFCAWGAASKDMVRRFDLETALAEIDYVSSRSKARNWIVCDANFGILKRDVEIATAIRQAKDRTGWPDKCHIWLAKNATDRNLEIGEILGDMTVPVMAVQSLTEQVMANIKRDNISTDTYIEYQKKFHRMGSRTYSDLIVPLPGETLATHIDSLRKLCDFGVDIIQSHNMRLLAGAETNSTETRKNYDFKTRYRLIHGDAGIYNCPDGTKLHAFEYEESLRGTSTMKEDDLFYLRKLHFLIDIAWNTEVYKPLLKTAQIYGINPVDALQKLLQSCGEKEPDSGPETLSVTEFFTRFDHESQEEWFDSADEIETYFNDKNNFSRLINLDFEKLNIKHSLVLLQEFKPAFDAVIYEAIKSFNQIPDSILKAISDLNFATFPPIQEEAAMRKIEIPANLLELGEETVDGFTLLEDKKTLKLEEHKNRRELREIIGRTGKQTLSKIMNTQSFSLRDLQLTFKGSPGFSAVFRQVI
ncbi:MAG: hypothetical protein HOO00_05860 [Rhodospirillaceae bacterium]|jgi:radical SAM superfamily enzyme YgiQ (UPF0313 family)|nr:hypothetical protein [Rhodospirillaceae bacterium]MBT5374874.1 hypothetical protein [Rhodospirillaceae bacterium]MBT5751562.1 hypothetical protein [Rhodospirillaceae bacterium]